MFKTYYPLIIAIKNTNFFDKRGRVEREEEFRDEVYAGGRTYQYHSASSNKYSIMKTYNENKNVTFEMHQSVLTDGIVFENFELGKITNRSYYNLTLQCTGVVINRNGDGQLTSMEVYERTNK